MNELNWTEEQKTMIQDLINEEIEKARLSHKFIEDFPVSETARSVPGDIYDPATNTVDDVNTIPLVELIADVNLTKQQVEDEDLSIAIMKIKKAAVRLARAHDAITFLGQPDGNKLPKTAPFETKAVKGYSNGGFKDAVNKELAIEKSKTGTFGEDAVNKVAKAMAIIEGNGYIGNFVLIVGVDLWVDIHTASPNLKDLPIQQIKSLLEEAPIHKTTVINPKEGFLISLGGNSIDIAIATKPKFEFLRIGSDEIRECRIFERFALRFKERDSVVWLKKQDSKDAGLQGGTKPVAAIAKEKKAAAEAAVEEKKVEDLKERKGQQEDRKK